MEKRGAINVYSPYKWEGKSVWIINLADGVTPFMHIFGGREYASSCYRLGTPKIITVTLAHYRPTKEEFDQMDKSLRHHVLNGGLLHDELPAAIAKQLPVDPVDATWGYEVFQEWCVKVYGQRLGPLELHGSA